MYDYYDYDDDNSYRPDGINITGPIPIGIGGGPGPFGGGMPPFGQPPFGQPPFGQPPFGQPPFGQPPFGQPPFGQPPFGQGQSGPPSGPPPAFTPPMAGMQGFGGPSVFAIDPGAIRRCLFRFVFIRLESGRSFWAWLTFVGRNSVAGWRWNGFRWVYFGIDLDQIQSFYCF